jgi:hypothetical protein
MAQRPRKQSDIDEAVKLVYEHGSITAAAKAAGIPRATLSQRYHATSVPLSEDVTRFHEDWTADDCRAELQRIANLDTEKVISRNYFRNNSKISESTWNRYFGTFEEYKRQSGIKLARQVHHLEKQIAKHASVDQYRALNAERQDYDKKYLRADKRRFKTVLVASDLHDHECDRFFLRVLIDAAKRIQPDAICLNGDIFDLPEFGKYTVDPRQWNPSGRIKFVHNEILEPLREACPDAQIDFTEGNHEFRLMRHLADATPALKAILSDLHGMTVPKLLGLDKYEINYIAKADLAAYTLSDIKEQVGRNYKVYWDCMIAHHYPEGASLGMPGINGHHHKWHVRALHNERFGAYQWVQGGAGHMRDATYANGERWSLNFNLAHIDTEKRHVNWECVSITDFAVVGGKYYYRDPVEAVPAVS